MYCSLPPLMCELFPQLPDGGMCFSGGLAFGARYAKSEQRKKVLLRGAPNPGPQAVPLIVRRLHLIWARSSSDQLKRILV